MKKLLLTSLLLAGCGTEQSSDLDIVGGQKAPYKSWFGFTGRCGATLFHKRFAVSAQHCGTPKKVTFGFYRRGSGNGGKPKDSVQVKRVIHHPSWDLSLIELERPTKLKPIRLHGDTYLEDGARLASFGLGNTTGGGSGPEFLQGAVFFFNKKATQNARESIIRASAPGKATCHGDSGGPLIFRGELVATNTFTVGKCQPGGLMGFTRLDIDWIRGFVK